MDEGLSEAVREVFIRLYREGLIYRSHYIINWCPRCQTALADLEVEHEETPGKLYYLKYPLKGEDRFLVVATTRPETMLGDTAVAVNPEDKRYQADVGKKVVLPVLGREIPVIGDAYVDIEFGTGALKITPAHDFNDFEIGLKHDLEQIKVIDEEGRMRENTSIYQGLDRFECRSRIVDDLERDGILLKTEDYRHMVGHCYRCKTDCRAQPLTPVVRQNETAGPNCDGSRQGRPDPDRSRGLGKDLFRMDGEHPRLVHLPSDLVGPPHSRPGIVMPVTK